MLLHHSSCLFITIAWCWFSSLIVLVRRSYCVSLSQQFCIGLPVSLSLYHNSFVLVHQSSCLALSRQFCVGSPLFLCPFITSDLCWFISLLVPLAKPSSLVTSLLDTMSLYLEQAVVSPMLMESAQVFMIAIKRSCYDWLCCPWDEKKTGSDYNHW